MAIDLSSFVVQRSDGVSEVDFAVRGMTCAACMAQIEQAISRMPGAPSARVNYSTRRLKVAWRDAAFRPNAVAGVLAPLGYRAEPFEFETVESEEAAEEKRLIRCMAIAGFAAMNVMLLSVAIWAGAVSGIDPATRDLFHWLSGLIALPAAAFAGQPFFRSAFSALRAHRLNMDVPISVGLSLALGMSVTETILHAEHAYFDSALMLMFFLLAGRALDLSMRRKTRGAVNNLSSLRALQACRLGPDGPADVPAKALCKGDLVLVRSGERLPADGLVTSGEGEVDDSVITGETMRRAIAKGDPVYAGSINFVGAIQVEVGASGGRTLFDEIERMLEAASTAKSRYRRLADRASKVYAPVVHLAALCTAAAWLLAGASWHDALVCAISVLIITCPCALALAVPAVHVAASGALFRTGVLLRNGDALERLAQIDTVILDKTGTLTTPEPGVVNRADAPADILAEAARLALSSRHPLARSLAAEARGVAPFDVVTEDVGSGVRALIDGAEVRLGSLRYCGITAEQPGGADRRESNIAFRHGDRSFIFRVRQILRPDAAATIGWLKRHGIAVEIASGDSEASVQEVARMLQVGSARSGARPADKVERLSALRALGRKALMVGDGLNDAPSLAGAHASMSPSTAADIAQSASDAIFLGESLAPICAAIAISRAARRRMLQNLTLAVVYNALAVPLAVAGMVTPLIAALAMSGSSLLVTANALRSWRVEDVAAADAVAPLGVVGSPVGLGAGA